MTKPSAAANLQPRMTVRDAARPRHRRRPSAVLRPQTDQARFDWRPGELVTGQPRREHLARPEVRLPNRHVVEEPA
jgi:hypothetical protein